MAMGLRPHNSRGARDEVQGKNHTTSEGHKKRVEAGQGDTQHDAMEDE